MLLYLNDDKAEIWELPTRSKVQKFHFIRGSSPEINVRRTQGGAVSSYSGSATGTLTFKSSRTAGSVLIPTVTWSALGGNTFQFQPTFLSTELDTLLDDDDSAVVYGEIKVADSPDLFLFEFIGRVYANTNRGGESVPGVITSAEPIFLSSIERLEGGTGTDLDFIPTVAMAVPSTLYTIVIDDAASQWRLVTGPAVTGDITPSDYHASTNNKVWRQVEGYVG